MASQFSRRSFLKGGGAIAAGAIAGGVLTAGGLLSSPGSALAAPPAGKAKVFFTNDLSLNGLLKIYGQVNQGMTGNVGIKLHTGEPEGPNLLPMSFIKGLQASIPDSTIVECNVLYDSPRRTTQGHLETLKINGWDFCPVDILDSEGDAVLPIPGMRAFLDAWGVPARALGDKKRPYVPGVHLTELAVGRRLLNYDSLLVYTHFKGHAMGGFGGSLKNIAIGCASGQGGKRQIHGDGWQGGPLFLERMVEGGKAVSSFFGPRITYINVLMNMSVDCDCSGKRAAKATCPDLGIVGSTDLLAIEQASIDMVYALPEAKRHDLVERIESRSGLHQLEYMETLQMGSKQYELVTL